MEVLHFWLKAKMKTTDYLSKKLQNNCNSTKALRVGAKLGIFCIQKPAASFAIFLFQLTKHESLKLIVVDPSRSVFVNLCNHLVQIRIRKSIIKLPEDFLYDVRVNFSFSIFV